MLIALNKCFKNQEWTQLVDGIRLNVATSLVGTRNTKWVKLIMRLL